MDLPEKLLSATSVSQQSSWLISFLPCLPESRLQHLQAEFLYTSSPPYEVGDKGIGADRVAWQIGKRRDIFIASTGEAFNPAANRVAEFFPPQVAEVLPTCFPAGKCQAGAFHGTW
jgi:hypothetical protein